MNLQVEESFTQDRVLERASWERLHLHCVAGGEVSLVEKAQGCVRPGHLPKDRHGGVRVHGIQREMYMACGGRDGCFPFHQSKFLKGDCGAVFIDEMWEDIPGRGSSSCQVMRWEKTRCL